MLVCVGGTAHGFWGGVGKWCVPLQTGKTGSEGFACVKIGLYFDMVVFHQGMRTMDDACVCLNNAFFNRKWCLFL